MDRSDVAGINRIRLASQGDGGGRKADGYVYGYRRTGQADRRARRSHVSHLSRDRNAPNLVSLETPACSRQPCSSVLPMQQSEKFKKLGIRPPKGCLMYGPPGTGKTLLARACAAQTNACYLKLAGPSLVQVSHPLGNTLTNIHR